MRPRSTILVILLGTLLGCPNTGQDEPVGERDAEDREARSAQPGCDADVFPRESCFSATISLVHHDMARAVGSPEILRERLAAAGVASVQLNNGDRTVATLYFDSQGRLVRQEGQTRYEVEYGVANRIRRILRFRNGSPWSDARFNGTEDTCTIVTEIFARNLTETVHCRADGNQILRDGTGARRVTLGEDEIRFDTGSSTTFDRLGRIIEERSGSTYRTFYEDGVTRSVEVAENGEESPIRDWILDEHRLPLKLINHVASFSIDHVYEERP